MRRLPSFLIGLTFAAAATSLSPAAFAQAKPKPADPAPQPAAPAAPDAKAIEEAKKHFAQGKKLLDAGDSKGAVEEFKEAYRLSKNPILLYNIGFVYDSLHDKPLALHYYQKFLDDAPESEKTHDNRILATQRVADLTKEIAAEDAATTQPTTQPDNGNGDKANGDKGGDKGNGDKGGDKAAQPFVHVIIEETPPGKPLDITAKVADDSGWKLTLYYRPAGEDEFHTVRMKQRYQELVGRIPAEAVKGSSIQYYIEVKDANGKLVAASGRASSPNIVNIDDAAKPHFYADLSENGSGAMGEGEGEGEGNPIPGPGPDKKKLTPFTYAKWGTTGGAVALLTTSVVLYFIASGKASDLETEAYNSTHRNCTDGSSPPCAQFSDYQRGLQADGKAYATMTNVTFALGAVAAVAAGGLWYWELSHKKHKKTEKKPKSESAPENPDEASLRIIAAPMVGDGVIGGMAVFRF